MNNQKIM